MDCTLLLPQDTLEITFSSEDDPLDADGVTRQACQLGRL